ncbi:MAG: hypothetical protein IPP54_17455 [Anaerolineales bacterium]|nr:hypothetical protein [Anaerolineales bacterium]
MLAIRATTARHQRDYQTSVKLGEQALKIVPDGNVHLLTIVSAGLSTSLIEVGDYVQADSVTSSTRHMAYQTGHSFIAFSMLMNESMLAMLRGQLHKVYKFPQRPCTLRKPNPCSISRLFRMFTWDG